MDIYWIWLSETPNIGDVIGKKLLEEFKTPKNIFDADKEELMNVEGIGEKTANLIFNSKYEVMNRSETIMKKCEKNNIKLLNINDSSYPPKVKNIQDSPILLYYLGTITKDCMGVGIVGSRRCTSYGKKIAKEAAEFLAENNISVISGMAKGIDGYSHTACINSGGYTIAFLGGGVDKVYPKEHIKLMEEIIAKGAVISEYPPGTKPYPKNFPKRNRLISAFSNKLLVVEAGEDSGSLITAQFAKKYNREVFAVPNNIFSKESRGCNKLILNGATLYIFQQQLLDSYSNITSKNKYCISNVQVKNNLKVDYIEKIILNAINKEPKTIEQLQVIVNDDKVDVLEKLSLMELDGKIKAFQGKFYSLA
ncbi:DNA processing protein DprA [Clostridium carboxidivorans P7]|uniref:DNA protecting protein DprA n=1 Tax=Clostridium carboxidivorans P7 TaxID=536227 RepID=C6PXR7_9CLOT|nr:DNA-processing protein DprA [Clostridium carboxidivorans]AKN33465.1 DNA processing protein DprA [Clostridium carboxidivorans P7]EET85948.1 DNA protecting protein DprA [Clostridium carboxidivorans P7]EFG89153.1 DNA protecting protein DprA [Clostridium carboxidivorans P7]